MTTAFFCDAAKDAALQYITTNGNELVICSQLPATYTEAHTTYKLGTKASPTIGSPADDGTAGRKITVSAITDGSVSGSGTASHFAITKTGTSELLAAGPLSSSQSVTSGNTFTLTAFDIKLPDAA